MAAPLNVEVKVGTDGMVRGLKVATSSVADAAEFMRQSLASIATGAAAATRATHEVSGATEGLLGHMREMRSEARLGSFISGQIAAMGIASKSAASEVAMLAAGFMMGGPIGAGIEVVKMIVTAFNEMGEATKLANEKAQESTKHLKEETDLLILSINGATAAEKLRFKEIKPLEELALEQKRLLYQEYANLYRAEEQVAEAKKAGILGAEDQLVLDRAHQKIDKAKELLAITQKQIAEGEKLIGGVDSAQSAKDAREAREKAALDAAKWREFEIQETKKHYDAITKDTLKFFTDKDAAEDKDTEHLLKNLDEEQKEYKKQYDKLTTETLKAMEKINADEKKQLQESMMAAKQMGAAFGAAFAGIVDGTESVGKAFKNMAKASVKAIIDMAIKTVEANAIQAASGAATSVAPTPFVGPALAVTAMVATEAVVLGLLGSIPSAAGGWNVPTGINPITQLHGGEMVLDRKSADTVRDGGGGGHTFNFNGVTDASWWKANQTQIVGTLRDATRNGRF